MTKQNSTTFMSLLVKKYFTIRTRQPLNVITDDEGVFSHLLCSDYKKVSYLLFAVFLSVIWLVLIVIFWNRSSNWKSSLVFSYENSLYVKQFLCYVVSCYVMLSYFYVISFMSIVYNEGNLTYVSNFSSPLLNSTMQGRVLHKCSHFISLESWN